MTEPLTKQERLIVVDALRAAARRIKGKSLGKGDPRLLAERRKERYAEVNDLATAIQARRKG